MRRIVRLKHAAEVGSGAARITLERGHYLAYDLGSRVTLTPYDMASRTASEAASLHIASSDFELLLSCRDLVYVSW